MLLDLRLAALGTNGGVVCSLTDKEITQMESVRWLIRFRRKDYQLLNDCFWRKADIDIP
jgi:hypothetical protein